MAQILNYRDLEVWNRAMELVESCYQLTRNFPVEERYGLTSQLRRAACSIPSNVAEGHSRRGSTPAYANHVSIALGSNAELETCIEIGARLGFLRSEDKGKLDNATASVRQMLSALHRALEEKMAREVSTKPRGSR